MEYRENNIEFYTNEDTATASFTQIRHINKIKKLAKKHPDECKILAENDDGSILVHFPVNWIRIQKPAHRELSEEEKIAMAARLKNGRGNHDE